MRTIEQQAKAFREGVEEVTGSGCLGLLSASELKVLWAGQVACCARVVVGLERGSGGERWCCGCRCGCHSGCRGERCTIALRRTGKQDPTRAPPADQYSRPSHQPIFAPLPPTNIRAPPADQYSRPSRRPSPRVPTGSQEISDTNLEKWKAASRVAHPEAAPQAALFWQWLTTVSPAKRAAVAFGQDSTLSISRYRERYLSVT